MIRKKTSEERGLPKSLRGVHGKSMRNPQTGEGEKREGVRGFGKKRRSSRIFSECPRKTMLETANQKIFERDCLPINVDGGTTKKSPERRER